MENLIMEYFFFYIGLSFLLTHEMDAVRLKEWKIFPILSGLKEQTGYLIFTSIHIVLFILIFWGLNGNNQDEIRRNLIFGLNIFFIIHILLHLMFLRHRNNHFKSIFSWSLIVGAGIFGTLDLIINFFE